FLPGVYTQYLRSPEGCYFNLVIDLAVRDTLRDTIYRTVCAGVSFDTNGQRYYQPGQYIQHLRQPDSCYNNLVINISVLDTVRDTIYRTVCAGVSFDTNGSRYYLPGQYTQHLRQPDSCYNNLVINISVRDTVRDTIYREVCAGASFDTNGQSFYFPGTFTQHLRQPDSCYNNLVIEMSVRDTIRDTIYRTICAGETFDTNGRSYAQRGVYTQYLRDPVTRCYNDLVIFLTVNDTFRDHIYDTVCAGMPTSHNGIYYYMPGTHLQRYQTVLGCDSIVAIHLYVLDTIRDTIYREVCAGASFDTNGVHYYFQGYHTQHLRDSVPGCFHNLVIHLTVRDTIRAHVYDTICEGTTYRFNSSYYTTTGVYRYMMKTAEGCDSITYLHLQVNPVTYVRVFDTSYTNVYYYHDSVYTRNGVYRHLLQREGTGCDSMVELHLWFCDSILTKVYDTICNDSTYLFGNNILTRSGIYYRVVPSHLNCDSIIELHLKVVDYPRVEIVDSGGYCINGYATLRVVTDGNRIVWSSFPLDSSLFGQEGNRTIYVSPSRHTIYTVEVDSVPRVRTCKASASLGIHKASTVKAQMARDPMETTMEHLQTKFADISVGNVVYREWLFHETSPLAPDKRYEYDSIVWYSPLVESDSFRVRLAVRNDVGCTDTVVNMYPILKADLWVPNAFTPDENLNYLFKVGTYNLAEYEIYIYNRGGLLVFHSTDPDDSWDGTHNGNPCIPASYVYVINYTTNVHPKQPQKKVGSVLLIR
ncbi:MAG: gliding motility-associated C-terminal domain-containing protein, partial [Bacteroidales bacterium]|nr:gliding motility-associated C-terminal domain-containing protein [Bacteroidales bacterium]